MKGQTKDTESDLIAWLRLQRIAKVHATLEYTTQHGTVGVYELAGQEGYEVWLMSEHGMPICLYAGNGEAAAFETCFTLASFGGCDVP